MNGRVGGHAEYHCCRANDRAACEADHCDPEGLLSKGIRRGDYSQINKVSKMKKGLRRVISMPRNGAPSSNLLSVFGLGTSLET